MVKTLFQNNELPRRPQQACFWGERMKKGTFRRTLSTFNKSFVENKYTIYFQRITLPGVPPPPERKSEHNFPLCTEQKQNRRLFTWTQCTELLITGAGCRRGLVQSRTAQPRRNETVGGDHSAPLSAPPRWPGGPLPRYRHTQRCVDETPAAMKVNPCTRRRRP